MSDWVSIVKEFCPMSPRGTRMSIHWYVSKYRCPMQTIFSNLSVTHWGRETYICVGKLTTIGSDNGLLPERRLAIIWTSAGILLIGPLGTNYSEILIEIQTFSLKKIRLKMSSAKCYSFRLGLSVLMTVNVWVYFLSKCNALLVQLALISNWSV